jgi:hypothetical protein
MSHRRIRLKQTLSFAERLMKAAEDTRVRAEALEPGRAKDDLLQKAREFEAQIGLNGIFQSDARPK